MNLSVVPESVTHNNSTRAGSIILQAPTRAELLGAAPLDYARQQIAAAGMVSPVPTGPATPYAVDANGNEETAATGQAPVAAYRAEFKFMSRL